MGNWSTTCQYRVSFFKFTIALCVCVFLPQNRKENFKKMALPMTCQYRPLRSTTCVSFVATHERLKFILLTLAYCSNKNVNHRMFITHITYKKQKNVTFLHPSEVSARYQISNVYFFYFFASDQQKPDPILFCVLALSINLCNLEKNIGTEVIFFLPRGLCLYFA